MIWSKQEERALLKAVRKAASVSAAVDAVRQVIPGMTFSRIRHKLERMGQPPLSEIVAPNQRAAAQAAIPRTVQEDVAAIRLKDRMSLLEAKNKQLIGEVARKDDEIANYKALARPPIHIVSPKKVGGKQRSGVPVMLCSDWHVEEPVEANKVNGLNEYNLQVADRCIATMADSFEWMLRDPRYDCRAGVVWLGGDLLTGYIHPELVEGNLLSPQQAQIFLLDRIEGMLRRIAATCPNLDRIIVPCNSGNHGRATDKQRVSTREANSNEQVVYQTLARVLRDEPRIEFQIADGEWTELDVMGYRMAFTHGDSFQYGGGVGGVAIPIRRGIARQFQGRQIHQFSMGHFHTRQDYGDVNINGSMIGYGPYSQRIHSPYAPRQQSWFMIDANRGKSISAPIWFPADMLGSR